MASQKIPFGLIAIIASIALLGILSFLGGAYFLLETYGTNFVDTIFDVFACAFGAALLAGAFGLWRLKEWGRKTTFYLSVTLLFLDVLVAFFIIFFLGDQETTVIIIPRIVGQLIRVSILVFAIFYLSRDRVKALFVPEKNPANTP